MRVALYARVSSEGQADRGTIDAQADFLRRYAELNSLDIAGEYSDEAITGPTPLTERPAGRRLVEDARAKKFGKVLFYRVDRFARSLRELLEAQALLTTLGIDLQSATEPFDTATPMGRFMFQLLGGIAELEKSVILERTTSGRARVARDGKWPGGPAPFGYCILDGRLAPSPTEADVIKDLYQRIASGSTLVREFNRLNDERCYGRQGKLWTMGGLSKLVHQPIYKGEHTFRGRGGTIVRDVPALVTAALWDEAHAQLKRNSTARETKRFSLLKGKMRCANCGGSYVLSSRAKRKQFYYRCVSTLRLTARRCKSANLNAPLLDAYVWGECLDLLQAPTRITAYATEEILRLRDVDTSRTSEIQHLQGSLASQEAAKQRIIRLVRLGKITDEDAERELDTINAEVGSLHARLSALDSSRSLAGAYIRRLRVAEAAIVKLAQDINPESQEDRRRAVDMLLHAIEVKTIGEGRERRVELIFKWLAQEPTGLLDPAEWKSSPPDADDNAMPGEPAEPGVLMSRLSAVLSDATSRSTSGAGIG